MLDEEVTHFVLARQMKPLKQMSRDRIVGLTDVSGGAHGIVNPQALPARHPLAVRRDLKDIRRLGGIALSPDV